MNMMTACASCFSDDNLRIIIAECLDYADLCALELTARTWRITSLRAFHTLRTSRPYKLRTFKDSSLYDTDKKICAGVYNSRSGLPDTMFLIGGSFGSPFTDTCSLADQPGSLVGTQIRSLNLPVRIGSAAFTQEVDGSLLVLGGWNDADEVSLQVYLQTSTSHHFQIFVSQTVLSDIFQLANRLSSPKDRSWRRVGSLPRPLCFPAAESGLHGDLLVIGGGCSPYRGGVAYKSCLLRRVEQPEMWSTGVVPPLHGARCGHSAVTTFDGSILVAGGYAGGTDYLSTVELLHPSFERWTQLPAMSVARSGMAMVLGPDGAVYTAGGSPDGTIGHKSLERFDLREGKWAKLSDMQYGRGYTAGVVSTWDTFYVCGGMDGLKFQSGMESYDFRKGLWSPAPLQEPFDFKAARQEIKGLTAEYDAACMATSEIDDNAALAAHDKYVRTLNEALTSRKEQLTAKCQSEWNSVDSETCKRACHLLLRAR
jgi:hypothetical protein